MLGPESTVASNPNLPFREIKVEKEEYGLASNESLDVVGDEFLADIDHLASKVLARGSKPCSIEHPRPPLHIRQLARMLSHSLQLVS